MLHDTPRCFAGDGEITSGLVFAPACDHDDCPSMCWHGLCLMRHRENREQRRQDVGRFVEQHRIVGLIVEKTEDLE